MYMQNLSQADQHTLNSRDFRPLIRRGFQEESLDYDHPDVDQQCDPCTFLDHTAFAHCSGPESQFRRRDLVDFYDLWLPENPGEDPQCDSICGFWVIDRRPGSGDEAVTIVQYKTFRICVRVGWLEGGIMFVP